MPFAVAAATSTLVGSPRVDATANYQHPLNDLSRGAVRAHVASNQVQLAQFQALVKDRPGLRGILSLNGDVSGNLVPAAAFLLIQAPFAVAGLRMVARSRGVARG